MFITLNGVQTAILGAIAIWFCVTLVVSLLAYSSLKAEQSARDKEHAETLRLCQESREFWQTAHVHEVIYGCSMTEHFMMKLRKSYHIITHPDTHNGSANAWAFQVRWSGKSVHYSAYEFETSQAAWNAAQSWVSAQVSAIFDEAKKISDEKIA